MVFKPSMLISLSLLLEISLPSSIFLVRPYEVIIAKRPVSALPPCVVNEGMRNTYVLSGFHS